MRQRIVLVIIALIAAGIATELSMALQRPSTPPALSQSTQSVPADSPAPLRAATAAPPLTAPYTPPQDQSAPALANAVVTSRQAIIQGTVLVPEQVSALFALTPVTATPPVGTLTSLKDLQVLLQPKGRITTATLLTGRPITLADIGLDNSSGHSVTSYIAKNDVAVALRVTGAAALQGIVAVGDSVNVIVALPTPTSPGGLLPFSPAQVHALGQGRVVALGPDPGEVTVATHHDVAGWIIAATEQQAHFYLTLASPAQQIADPQAYGPTSYGTTRKFRRTVAKKR